MKTLNFILSFILCHYLYAQGQNYSGGVGGGMPFASLSGKVYNSSDKQPIEFAAVSIYRLPKDTLIGGALSNEKGEFNFEKLIPGKYRLNIAFMGFLPYNDTLVLKKSEEKFLDAIYVNSNDKLLKEVTIVSQQDIVKNTIDKKVFNAEKLAVSNGGSANDVLSQVPTVDVDVEGNISLRGSGNVTILIDGRPSGMTGAGRAGLLSGIPASAIESVEVITNPSAKYDPDGMSGIINIVLKKNKLQGSNGNASLSAGNNHKYNGNLSLNYKKGNLNLFSNYSFRYNETEMNGLMTRMISNADSANYMYQNNNGLFLMRNHSAKLGADYSLSKKAVIGMNVNLNYDNRNDNRDIISKTEDISNHLISAYNRKTLNPNKGLSMDYNLNYRQKLNNPQQIISAESNYSVNNRLSNAQYMQENFWANYQEIPSIWSYQNNDTKTLFNINTNTIDFESPIGDNGKFESGLKNINRIIDNDFFSESYNNAEDKYVSDDSLNNRFKYHENIYSTYTSYGQTLNKWSYKAGIRAEQAMTNFSLLSTNENYINNYFNIFPSFFINRKLSEKQEIQFNYGRRLNRPGTRQLSPITDYSNPQFLHIGNPYLKPEYTHNFELGYLYNFKKVNVSVTAFYRRTNGLIMRNIEVNSLGQSIFTFTNLGSSDNMGLETVSRVELYRWWNITGNINAFQTTIKGTNQDGDINASNLSWNFKILTNILLGKGWTVQGTGSYNARNIIAQGYILPRSMVNLAVKKDILNNRGNLTLNVNDIFDKMSFRTFASGEGFTQENTFKRETRIVTLTFSYRFGSGDFSTRKQKARDNEFNNDDGGGF
ncbi:MAG: TonB-dependent receptor family protein [Bacteroidia bacterium]|nr:TonB-dependent receptor family protein [Bacteroidia bacterium]